MENISAESFKRRFLTNLPDGFQEQQTPVQIYPLEFSSQYILFPTPILKTDYYYIVYLQKGEYQQQMGSKIYNLKAPSLLFASEGSIFAINSMNKNISGYYIQIESKTISAIISKGELPNLLSVETELTLNKENNSWIQTICNLLHTEITSKKPNRKIGLGLLQALLNKIIDISPKTDNISRQREIAVQFKQQVYINFIEQKKVAFYASALNISENYLNRCVTSEYNKSCKQLILEISIRQSQILMFESSFEISEICYKVGFNDPSHFSRIFKKITGQTPTEFKEQIGHHLS